MMKSTDLFNNIQQFCKENADEAVVKKYSKYFKEGYNGYGLDRQHMETKINELAEHPEVNLALVFEAAPLLFASGKYEETSFVLLLTYEFRKEFNKEVFNRIETWFKDGICNWGHADYMATILMFEFLNKQIITYHELANWRQSKNLYQRRCVPVSMINVAKKMDDDYQQMVGFAEPLMMDPERPVHQGIGWFLREIWKLSPELVESFLLKWKDNAPRLIFQYALEKMPKEERVRFRRSKK